MEDPTKALVMAILLSRYDTHNQTNIETIKRVSDAADLVIAAATPPTPTP